MSVILNGPAIEVLFNSVPVVNFVERKTREKIVDATAQQVDDYFKVDTLHVDDDVDLEMHGSTAVVGIRDTRPDLPESKGRRLVRQGLIQKWLRAAVDEARVGA